MNQRKIQNQVTTEKPLPPEQTMADILKMQIERKRLVPTLRNRPCYEKAERITLPSRRT